MSKVELQVTADTSQAEKALAELTQDVDKLQRKGKELAQKNKRNKYKDTKGGGKAEGKKESSSRSSSDAGVKSAINALADKMGTHGKMFKDASTKLIDQLAKLALVMQGLKGLSSVKDQLRGSGFRSIAKDSASLTKASRRLASQSAFLERRAHLLRERGSRTLSPEIFERRADLRGVQSRNLAGAAELNRLRARYRNARAYYGWEGDRLTPRQRINRGLTQLRGGSVPPLRNRGPVGLNSSFLGMNTTRLAGAGNLIRGGIGAGLARVGLGGVGAGSMGAAGMGAAAGSVLGVGLGAVGGLISGMGAGAGAVTGGMGVASPFILMHANQQIDKGRAKADEFARLNAQLSTLAKNFGKSGADKLAKDIQKLAIEGSVSLDSLTRGAQSLMLAFKGSTGETAKWLPILADLSAGTGQSVEFFGELITRAKQFGKVDFEVFNQLNEKGIPVIEKLAQKLGITTEEAKELAREGKVTADQFLEVFENAAKASTAGANVRAQQSTITGLQQSTQGYEELRAANYTQGYDAEMMNYERWRNRKAKQRAEDKTFEIQGKFLGKALADVTEGFKRFKANLFDVGEDILNWSIRKSGIADSHAQADIAQLGLWVTTGSFHADGIRHYRSEDDPDRYLTAEEMKGEIAWMEQQRDALYSYANNSKFNDETRSKARAEIAIAEEHLRTMQATLERLEQEEAEKAEREREAAEEKAAQERGDALRKELYADKAKTPAQIAIAAGLDWKEEDGEQHLIANLKFAILQLEDLINNTNSATEADLEKHRALTDALSDIEEIYAQRKEAEEEAARIEKEKAEAAAREAARLKEEQRQRDRYLLEREYDRLEGKGPQAAEIKTQLEFDEAADKLKKLGFTINEIDAMLTEDRANAIVEKEKALAENETKIKEAKQEIEDSKKTGWNMETNAWGSTGRLYTNFTNSVDEKQLKELEGINTKLEEEINALNRLDLTPYAQ